MKNDTGVELLLGHAKHINAAHHAGEESARTALEHYHRAGMLLAEVKVKLPHGAWLPWLEANFDGNPRTAQRYVKLADNWDAITNTTDVSHLTLAQALRQLEKPRDEKPLEEPADEETPDTYTFELTMERVLGQLEEPQPEEPADEETLDTPTIEQHDLYMKYKLMPDMNSDEWRGFKNSIKSFGVINPLSVDEQGKILDGHMRLKAWFDLLAEGYSLPPLKVKFEEEMSESEKRLFIYRVNVIRKHLTASQRAALIPNIARELELEESERQNRAASQPVSEPDSKGSPLGFVLAMNVHRRHLNDSQRAVLAVEMARELELEESAAEQRG